MKTSATTPDEWTPEVAEAVAASEHVTLSVAHWRVISCLREIAARQNCTPTLEDLRECCGISAAEIRTLFPGAATALLSRIAGLPD